MDGRSSGQAWERPRLTFGTLAVLGAMNLSDCVSYSLPTPYVDEMVSRFMERPTDDASVVQTVGLLIGLYSLSEVVFSPFWGFLADYIGRRPVMLIGLAGSTISPVLFGFAGSLPLAFLWRGMDGFFCGNTGVVKTYLGELVDRTNEARGFSFLAVCFSLGLFIGPMLGGQLVDVAVWWPTVFRGTAFERHPYLLPNLIYALFAGASWLLGFCLLPETLPPWDRYRGRGRLPHPEGLLSNREVETRVSDPDMRRKTRDTLIALLFVGTYCLLTGYYAAWVQNYVLIVSLPRSIDGFNLTPQGIGMTQNAAAVGQLSTQLLLYPYLTKRFGFLVCFIGGCIVNSIVTLLFPVYGIMADPDTFGAWRYAPLLIMMTVGQAASGFCFPTVFVWINRALEGKDRGTWNGWCNSLGALSRAVLPPAMDGLLSFGLRSHRFGGRYMPVFANAVIGLSVLILGTVSVRIQDASNIEARSIQVVALDGVADATADAGRS